MNDWLIVAEKTGLAPAVAQVVIEDACRQAKAWEAAGNPVAMVVPLTLRQAVDPNLPDTVAEALTAADLPADYLMLAPEESAWLQLDPTTESRLEALHGHGVQFGIDRFGSGTGSLTLLGHRLVSHVIVDGHSPMVNVDASNDSRVLLAVLELADRVGITWTISGVDSPDLLAVCQGLGRGWVAGDIAKPPVSAASSSLGFDRSTGTSFGRHLGRHRG